MKSKGKGHCLRIKRAEWRSKKVTEYKRSNVFRENPANAGKTQALTTIAWLQILLHVYEYLKLVKVGISGYGNLRTMSTDEWTTSKSTQLSTKVWVKLLLLLENALKLNFEALWLSENLNPLQGPTHTLTPSSINTQNRSKNYVWIYHGMHWTLCYRSKLYI